jgi:ATP-dependent helicase/nuclease subunit B
MGFQALLGSSGLELEAALHERLAAIRRADRFAPLAILVGSNLLGAYLRRNLAAKTGGLFNVRFLTFAELASLIAREAEEGAGPTAPPFADRVVVGELAASGRISPGLAEAARTRGFADALIATFDDLAEAGCTPGISRALLDSGGRRDRLGAKAEEVLSLFGRFRERIESLGGDMQTRFAAALERPLPRSLGEHLFVYGFYDFNEMQRRLLARLARERDVTMFMPWGEGEAFRFAAKGRAALEGRGLGPFMPAGGAVAGRRGMPALKLLNVPGEEEEVREIARRILDRAGRNGSRFSDVAVILPSIETYAPLCREVFREAGIPCSMHAGSGTEGGPALRGALGLLGIIGGGPERRELVEFLVSAPLRTPDAGPVRSDRFSLWARLSAEAGIVGERGWIEESAAFVERLRSSGADGGKSGEALAAALDVDAVIGKIFRAGVAMRAAVTWDGLARSLASLARDLFPAAEDLEPTCAAIERLGALDRLGSPVSFEPFSRIAEAALAEAARSAERPGDGVNVLSFAQARGLTFEAVFVPGLAERIFPTAARQDPFLGDLERAELNAISRGALVLPERGERLSEEALLFALARSSAREAVVCSYPRFEGGTGRERIPSSFLRFVEGYSIDGAHGEDLDYERIAGGAPAARGAALLSARELDFERARAYRDGAGSLPDNPFFSKGARLVRERWGARKFTTYDGVFSSKQALGELRAMLEGHGRRFSPTSLETYARCPFAYFLTRVLGIEAVEEPERVVSIGPLERGELIHGILAGIYSELKRRGLLPLSVAPPGEVRAIAERIMDRFLEDFPKEASVGFPVFWEMEKRLVRESVLLFLEEERLEGGDFVPELFERWFGGERDRLDVSIEGGGRTVLFRGRIDRIDAAPGGRFRVVDYKTGRLGGTDQDLARGSALQLPVYLLAAAGILGLDLRDGEARYRRVGIGEGKNVVSFFGNRWDESREQFVKIVETIVSGVEGGLFFAPADDQGCRNCDVKIACPSGMTRLFEIKTANDERARPYVEMRADGEEGA